MHLMAVNRLAKSSPDWVAAPASGARASGGQGNRRKFKQAPAINLEAFIGRLA